MQHNVRLVCTEKNEFLAVEGDKSFTHWLVKFSSWPGGTKGDHAVLEMQLPKECADYYEVGVTYYFSTKVAD
jgi:hypothetical protein